MAPPELVTKAILDGVDETARQMERKWGVGRLRLLVDDALRAKFDAQKAKLDAAIATGQVIYIRAQAEGMRRAWQVLDRAASDAGAQPLAAEVWECVLPPSGEVGSIVPHRAEAHHVARECEVWTLAEVGVLIERMGDQVRQVRRTFPGAAVVDVRPREPPPPPIDWTRRAAVLKPKECGWRRRAWQGPAAILTTITHEGTIMAGSTLRAVRSEARAISVPVPAVAAGDPVGSAVLALDLGQKTGWAVRNADGAIASGTAEFKPGRFEGGGMAFLRFRAWLLEVDQTTGGVDTVYFEEVRSHRGVAAAHAYGGFLAHLTAWAEANKVPYRGVPVATIKRHATGQGNANKEAVMAAVRALGFAPADDNEADALAMLHWALSSGGRR